LKIAADAAIWQTHNDLKRFETSLSINAMNAEPVRAGGADDDTENGNVQK
jgi:hypothetical protein